MPISNLKVLNFCSYWILVDVYVEFIIVHFLVKFWVTCKKHYSFIYTFINSKFVLWVIALEYTRRAETKINNKKKAKPIEMWKV
jgi:hypothetical protein